MNDLEKIFLVLLLGIGVLGAMTLDTEIQRGICILLVFFCGVLTERESAKHIAELEKVNKK